MLRKNLPYKHLQGKYPLPPFPLPLPSPPPPHLLLPLTEAILLKEFFILYKFQTADCLTQYLCLSIWECFMVNSSY